MATKERHYDLSIPQEMSEDMSKLADEIGGDLSDVFNRAMRFYYAVKTSQLALEKRKDLDSPYWKSRAQIAEREQTHIAYCWHKRVLWCSGCLYSIIGIKQYAVVH